MSSGVLEPMIKWKLGVEIELLAPRGLNRGSLAREIARARGGCVRRFFHTDSEPSKVHDRPTFFNLTPGFAVHDAKGVLLARLVDDITLQDDLDRSVAARPGWYRIVSDDRRLLRLVARHANPDDPLDHVLDPVGRLIGACPVHCGDGLWRLNDDAGETLAIACPLPGERERSCEIVTAPIERDHAACLESLLRSARVLGFQLPNEGAVHLHFDATSLRRSAVLANLVLLLAPAQALLRRLIGTNPRCRRLGPWPDELLERVAAPGFAALDWAAALECLKGVRLEKYCDVNLANLIKPRSEKDTIEIRTLPPQIEAMPILCVAALYESILRRACAPEPVAPITSLPVERAAAEAFLTRLPLATDVRLLLMNRWHCASKRAALKKESREYRWRRIESPQAAVRPVA
jgi:putative amidoligase enzyme